MKLRCISRYRAAGGVEYLPGQVLDLSTAHAVHLLTDSPGSFEIVTDTSNTTVGAPAEPEADKMIKGRKK